MNDNRRDYTIFCGCGCARGISVRFKFSPGDDEVFLDTVISGFEAHQFGIFGRIYRRLKAAWSMLKGEEYCTHEIMLSRSDFADFVHNINSAYCDMKIRERKGNQK